MTIGLLKLGGLHCWRPLSWTQWACVRDSKRDIMACRAEARDSSSWKILGSSDHPTWPMVCHLTQALGFHWGVPRSLGCSKMRVKVCSTNIPWVPMFSIQHSFGLHVSSGKFCWLDVKWSIWCHLMALCLIHGGCLTTLHWICEWTDEWIREWFPWRVLSQQLGPLYFSGLQ